MNFRPCIDIHNGQVKQIVGGSLLDQGNQAEENFVSEQDALFYAQLYKNNGIRGGHIILLNPAGSEFYEADKSQAQKALQGYPGGLQIGGGMIADNAKEFLNMGASHVIVTSYVFKNGKINFDNLNQIVNAVGKDRLVLDLSCRKKDGEYYIVTDRWQKFTEVKVTESTLNLLADYCDEFMIHAVDVEGKASGIEKDLVTMLGKWSGIPITYAGGVGSFEDIDMIKELGQNKLDVTIGSALDLFGGNMEFEEVLNRCISNNRNTDTSKITSKSTSGSISESISTSTMNYPHKGSVNFQKELDKLIKRLQTEGKVPTLLLHSCCAPCSSYVIEYLSQHFHLTVFYYNPNISESDEYAKRVVEQKRLINEFPAKYKVSFAEGIYDTENYLKKVKGLEECREGGERCFVCYEMRLRETAKAAKEGGFDYFTTTLSISPLKNSAKLNEIGYNLGMEYGVEYLLSDFKKREGYKRSIELSKEYELYRQNYCGCIFSKNN